MTLRIDTFSLLLIILLVLLAGQSQAQTVITKSPPKPPSDMQLCRSANMDLAEQVHNLVDLNSQLVSRARAAEAQVGTVVQPPKPTPKRRYWVCTRMSGRHCARLEWRML